jgi:hypothetical protein
MALRWLLVILTCSWVIGRASPCAAADHFLTIGGGSSPSNNQVSLEKNVLFFQRFLADRGMGGLPHEILFADGAAGSRDLQYVDPAYEVPRVNHLLAEVFHYENGLDLQYRAHVIPGLSGPSTRASINRWFDTIGSKLPEGDRLFIYYTGHGARGAQGRNTTLAIWNENDMPVKEFVKLLDRLPPKVSVVLVMVQCYGGGFADVIFNNADPMLGLSPRSRCGFFATLPNRVAAGCTADADEDNYHEYSTYFWSALYGRTRKGETVAPPDFNEDGRVSLAEAHAYALITSDTIDVSMKTSDTFLRQFSTTSGGQDHENWLTPDSPFDRLLGAADPPEGAELKGLSERLNLDGAARTRTVRSTSDALRRRRRGLEGERQKLVAARDQSCASLQSLLKRRWPELSNFLNPRVEKLLADEADPIVGAVESSPAYRDLKRQDERLDAIDRELDELERKQVKCQRFLRVVEHVALANNLPMIATPEVRARYEALVAEEGQTLAPQAQ